MQRWEDLGVCVVHSQRVLENTEQSRVKNTEALVWPVASLLYRNDNAGEAERAQLSFVS